MALGTALDGCVTGAGMDRRGTERARFVVSLLVDAMAPTNSLALNPAALRKLRASLPASCRHGYSTSRTCESGLSEQAGFPYRSVIDLVDACATARTP